ncbi:MAG: ribosome maturation factor RimM [candidate division WOR-3 bacterium]
MLFKVGKILKPHGLKGNLKIHFYDKDRELQIPEFFYINGEKFFVESAGRIGSNFIIKFKGIDDRTGAEKLQNLYVEVEEKDLVKLKKNQYHSHEIVGSKIFSKDGQEIGKVVNIIFLENGDVLEVDIKGKKETVLFKKDFFSEIDPENKILKLKYEEDFYAF